MKKFFAFVAAALVAFSFASCEKEQVGSNFFKITVSNIEATTADLSVVPADENAWYGLAIYSAVDVAKYTADTIAAYNASEIAAYVAAGYGLDVLAGYNYVFKGKLETPMSDLPANTELTVIAYQLVEQGSTVVLGKVSYKNFKTKELVVSDEVDLGVLPYGYFEDYRSEDGSYMAYGYDANSENVEIGLNIVDDDFVGNFTENDLILDYSYIWTKEMNSENGLSIAKAELVGKLNNADEANIAGWVIASNGIKYKFSFNYPTEELTEGAPKRVVRAAKAIPAFNKHALLKK